MRMVTRARSLAVAAALVWGVVAGGAATSAAAAIGPSLVQIGQYGSGAGELSLNGGGVAADPQTGHLFVSERQNNRVSEFTAWGEFVKAWGWGVADGAGEAQSCGPAEPTPEPEASDCSAGLGGSHPGQLNGPNGIAFGPNEELYVFERDNRRVQVFDQSGTFVRMFGGDVITNGAEGSGTVVNGSATVTEVETTSKLFKVGQTIEGTGIEAGTTIAAVGNQTITLSQTAGPGATGAGTAISAPEGPSNVPSNEVQTVSLGEGITGGSFDLTFTTPNPSPSSATASDIPVNSSAAEVMEALEGLANIGAGNVAVSGPAGGPWEVEFKGTRYADTDVRQLDPDPVGLLVEGTPVTAENRSELCPAASCIEIGSAKGGEVCAAAAECQGGTAGKASGEFSVGPAIIRTSRDYIDIAADGTVYVGDRNRIQKFDEEGNYLGEIDFTGGGEVGELPGPGNPGALALDPASGDIYFGYAWDFETVPAYRLDGTSGTVIYELPTTTPEASEEAIATDPDGNVFVAEDPYPPSNTQPEKNPHLVEIDGSGELVDECCPSTSAENEAVVLPALATNVVTEAGDSDLYVLHSSEAQEVGFIDVRGPAPDKWAPPEVPPAIEGQHASAVGEGEASVFATINPNFWSDTHFHLEYGTAPCSEGGCESTAEEELGAGIVKQAVQSEPIEVSGLEPGTTYHYRFVAESGGGGPVFGGDRTFATFAPKAQPPCPNDLYRSGAGARLADCRAYEMVSPLDKFGGEIVVQTNQQNLPGRLDQAAPSGEAITYSSYRSFGDNESAPYTSQYLARRGAGGWSTEGISPPRQAGMFNGLRIDSDYKGFSEDLSHGWVVQQADPPLAPDAVAGYPNLYRRDDASGSYEALTTVEPPATSPTNYSIELQGASADASRTVFRANGKLTATSNGDTANYQLYEAFKGNLRLVSVKPDGSASAAEATAGSRSTVVKNNRESNVETAISDDGTRIYWSEVGGSDKVYVRINAVKTVAVSTGAATFWAAEPDGSQAIYSEGGALKRFDLGSETSATLLGEGVQGVMGASEDLTRIYVVSTAALGGGAEAGKPNLYLYEEGEPLEFVATLAGEDIVPTKPAPTSPSPLFRLAHVTPDGAVAVFMSRAALTGADNTDQASGEADAEVFRYEVATAELRCVSCSPTGSAPIGRELQISPKEQSNYQYASRIPTWEFQLHETRVLSADGNRAFFDSLNRLLPADVNGAEDVYQWEAPGTGTCTEEAPGFNPAAAGCVTLISSGEDERDSEFVDASADGRDAFLLTGESLVSWDPGQIDLYDARAGGGLPAPPPARDEECDPNLEGDCQPQSAPPPPPPNTSQGFFGPGNPAFKAPCRKGFVRKHGKCVRKHQAKKHKHHGKKKGKKGKRAGRGARR